MGDEAAFGEWEKANPAEWQAFTTWLQANLLVLDASHRLYRQQYG